MNENVPQRGKRGLAFIELLVAVAIISILWIIMTRLYIGKIELARKGVCAANARIIQGQIEILHARAGTYPADKKEFNAFLRSLDYFAEKPICPLGESWKYDVKTHRVIKHRH